MRNLPLPLKVAILDTDPIGAAVLKAIIETKPDIADVMVFSQTKAANDAFRHNGYNSLFIDIFSLSAKVGVDFIEHTRTEYPTVPICLYSSSSALSTMPEVDDYWRKRFGHYFRLPKDQTPQALEAATEDILVALAYELQANVARYKLSDLKVRLSQEQSPHGFTPEQRQEIVETVAVAEKALESHGESQRTTVTVIPGVDTKQMEQLVNDTLKESRQSLQLARMVNIGVLVTGSLLMLVSFAIASITSRWEAVAFGGFGIAGVIASLITNPLKSISASASRLVQIQTAYFQFLSQLRLLSQDSETITIIERSQRLGDAMERTVKILGEYEK